MKVLHILESSIPCTTGYTVRARAIVDHQRRIGLDPVVVTSPLFPCSKRPADLLEEQHDGVRYYRTNHIAAPASARTKAASYALRALMLARYRRSILEIVRRERPAVLHAHSSYTNAYAGIPAARRFGIPLIYEVRTLWGESAVVEDGWRANSLKHRMIWRLELAAMRRADLVVPISEGIREELIARGIPASKLVVVPNGVDSTKFTPRVRDERRAESVGLSGRHIVGFVGTIRRLEGLDTLLSAFRICRSRRADIGLVIAGDGPPRKDLEKQVLEQGLTDVVFLGEVPHADVASWYSIMDVLVYPRLRAVITERVTPLKPLEAMAQGKVCVGSDVGGLRELIVDGDTGIIFSSGNAEALANALLGLIDDRARIERLKRNALRFVQTQREWSNIVPRYREIYDRAIRIKSGDHALARAGLQDDGFGVHG